MGSCASWLCKRFALYIFVFFSYHAKVPTELPSLEVKASYGLADPIAYEMPALHEKWTSEAYKCFDLSRNMPANPVRLSPKLRSRVFSVISSPSPTDKTIIPPPLADAQLSSMVQVFV